MIIMAFGAYILNNLVSGPFGLHEKPLGKELSDTVYGDVNFLKGPVVRSPVSPAEEQVGKWPGSFTETQREQSLLLCLPK